MLDKTINQERWSSWRYNVVDEFKGKTQEEIKTSLELTRNPFAVLMEHWKGDFNIGTLIRNSNAFNANEVFYVGKKRYDRRGAVGTHHYIDLKYIDDFEDLWKLKERYTFVCLDNNIDGVVSMEKFEWPENALMIFGEEGEGVTPEMLELADYAVSITQYGSVRSMNVGTTSGIAMYDYMKKYNG